MTQNSSRVKKVETPEMFSEIAPRYDFLNHFLSLNIDRAWRRDLVRCANLTDGGRVLDAATGTADVAVGFAEHRANTSVVGIDRSSGMLAIGQRKIDQKGLGDRVTLLDSDVLDLPFDDASFDVVTIAFGLRNLSDYQLGIQEMSRVLKPGGQLLVLEFSPPSNGLLLKGYRFYLQNILPVIGGMVSGSGRAYRYLSSSIGDFLSPEKIRELMSHGGLTEFDSRRLTGGIAYLYLGKKPDA